MLGRKVHICCSGGLRKSARWSLGSTGFTSRRRRLSPGREGIGWVNWPGERLAVEETTGKSRNEVWGAEFFPAPLLADRTLELANRWASKGRLRDGSSCCYKNYMDLGGNWNKIRGSRKQILKVVWGPRGLYDSQNRWSTGHEASQQTRRSVDLGV